jgi:CDP-4-dehydro-6-deoxyglucose reductase
LTHTIQLTKTGVQFTVEDNETILEAAENAGIMLAFSCRSGTCRSCIARVLSGMAEHDPEYADELNIDRDELLDGYRLLCSTLARSDLIVEK